MTFATCRVLGLPLSLSLPNGSDILKSCSGPRPLVGSLKDPLPARIAGAQAARAGCAIAQVAVATRKATPGFRPALDNEEQVKASKRTIVITERLFPLKPFAATPIGR